MVPGPITSWQIEQEKVVTVIDFLKRIETKLKTIGGWEESECKITKPNVTWIN